MRFTPILINRIEIVTWALEFNDNDKYSIRFTNSRVNISKLAGQKKKSYTFENIEYIYISRMYIYRILLADTFTREVDE